MSLRGSLPPTGTSPSACVQWTPEPIVASVGRSRPGADTPRRPASLPSPHPRPKDVDVRNHARRGRLLLLIALAFALAACGEAGQTVLDPQGSFAEQPDTLFRYVLLIALAVFVVVQALIIYAVVKYRDKGDDSPLPAQVHGNTRMELVWTIIPALILAGIAVPTIRTVFDLAETPEGAMEVEVIGHRWWWEYRYPGMGPDGADIVTANEMVIPVDTPIKLNMTALESGSADNAVIHSYWVPALAGKQDVVPGRITTLNMQADTTGVFQGQCTEYCGLSHANMRNYATVVTQAEFDEWVEQQSQPAPEPAEGSLAARGKELFSQGFEVEGYDSPQACINCHAINGDGANVGPDLTHLMSREMFAGAIFDLYLREPGSVWGNWTDEVNTEDLKAWLLNAPAQKAMRPTAETGRIGMPNLGLSEEEADALVAYLVTLE